MSIVLIIIAVLLIFIELIKIVSNVKVLKSNKELDEAIKFSLMNMQQIKKNYDTIYETYQRLSDKIKEATEYKKNNPIEINVNKQIVDKDIVNELNKGLENAGIRFKNNEV